MRTTPKHYTDTMLDLAEQLCGTCYAPGVWPSNSPRFAGAIFIASQAKVIEFDQTDDPLQLEASCDDFVTRIDCRESVEQLLLQVVEELLEPAPPLAIVDALLHFGAEPEALEGAA